MATAFVSEYAGVAVVNGVVLPVPRGLPLKVQRKTFSASVAMDDPISEGCALVGLWVDAAAAVKSSTTGAPTATTADKPLSAGVEWFYVPTGRDRHAFIAL
jgi:hypothetical protein